MSRPHRRLHQPQEAQPAGCLLDSGFLVNHVLANHRVVLLELQLVRSVSATLVGGIEMAGAGTGHQADLVACAVGHLDSPQTLSPRARRSARKIGRAAWRERL